MTYHKSAKVGDLYDDIIRGINTSVQVNNSIQASQAGHPAGGGGGTKVRDGDVAQAIDALAAQYHAIQSQNDVAIALQAAQAFLQALNNHSLFAPQNAGGQAYLAQAKTVVQKDINTYTAALSATPAEATVVNAAGQTVSAVTGQPVGISSSLTGDMSWIESHPVTGGVIVAALAYLLLRKQ